MALFNGLAREARFSLMDAIGQEWLATTFFVIWIAVVSCMLIGYRARTATVLNFILVLSVHERNVYILTGADTAMRVFSFWLMFAPVGRHYSVDALLGKRVPKFALPVRMLQLQLGIIYLVTAYLKLIGVVWQHGEALQYVLQLETIRLPLGTLLQQIGSTYLLKGLSYFVLIGEVLLPFLLFARSTRLRVLGIFIGLAIHGGIALTLAIPDFSLVMLSAYVLFLPTSWIDWLEQRFPLFKLIQAEEADSPPYQWVLSTILMAAMGLVIWWHVYTVGDYGEELITTPPPDAIWYTGLWQYWDMFAPLPYQIDGHMRVIGTFENGTTYDLYHHVPATEPPRTFWWGPVMRWKKFEENIFNYQYETILFQWAAYYCRSYNQESVIGTRLEKLEIIYVYRRSHAPEQPVNPMQIEVIWQHWCFE
ncbi:MAG: hypothetical protein Kow00117_20070 [Phototrophicales bacterium]